jgi:hypothetical protein
MELTRPEFRVLAKCDNSPLFSAAHRGKARRFHGILPDMTL